MLDSPGLTIAVRRNPPAVADLRATTVADDPVQRRDLILLERARSGDLDAFNDLVVCYQDQLFGLIARMVPDRDRRGRPGIGAGTGGGTRTLKRLPSAVFETAAFAVSPPRPGAPS